MIKTKYFTRIKTSYVIFFLCRTAYGASSALPPLQPFQPRIVSNAQLLPYVAPLADSTVLANGDGVELSKGGLKLKVTKCSAYVQARAAGYTAQTGLDMANESFFVRDCAPAQWFAKVKPASVSYVHDFRFTSTILAELPPCLLHGERYGEEQLRRALQEGTSLQALDPSFKVTQLSPWQVDFESDAQAHSVSLLGFGDFTGSGYEEVLISHSSHVKGGSARAYSVYALSKKAGDKTLRVAGQNRKTPVICLISRK